MKRRRLITGGASFVISSLVRLLVAAQAADLRSYCRNSPM